MTTCTHLSDRMPDIALARNRWSAEDERHLAACEDCRAEWAIVSAASRVGLSVSPTDPEGMATRILERVRAEPRRVQSRVPRQVLAGLAAAAAVALVVWAGRQRRDAAPTSEIAPPSVAASPGTPSPDTPAQRPSPPDLARGASPVDLPLPELDSLPAEVLDSMLHTLDDPLAHVGAYDLPPDESGDRELEQVLASLEG
jgi:hypothetical protein